MLLHKYGTPSHRLERVMTGIAGSLGVHGVFLYTPTALILSITDDQGEATYLRRVDSGAVDVDKLIQFDETLEQLEAGELSVSQARNRLDDIASSPPAYTTIFTVLTCAVSCAAVAIFFRGTLPEIMAAAVIGFLVAILELAPRKLDWEPGVLEPIAGFMAAVLSLAIAQYVHPVDDRLVTLAGLIIMVPGLRITVAVTELAVGHLSAGVARLAGACVSLTTLTIGVALGWRIAGGLRNIPVNAEWQLSDGWQWLAIALAPITFSIVFNARWPQWPVIASVSIAGFLASLYAGGQWGIEMGGFCGALAVGLGSNLYARLCDRPALVPLTPGIIVLVPGSLGFRSLTAFLDHETIAGIDFAFSMLIVAVALVGGILLANVVLPPKRIL